MASGPQVMAHERDYERSRQNLSAAWLTAARNRPGGYNSESQRSTLIQEFRKRNPGMEPYEWQLDVSEAVVLGLDCVVIAGTGAGKTMPFVMPLFAAKNRIVIIISPLNALEEDQAAKFNTMGLSAVAVNKDTYTKDTHMKIARFTYNIIITSPELALEHDRFRSLLSNIQFSKYILAIVIDEAHCITQWGPNFRPLYKELGTLRSFVSIHVPFLVTSATLTPASLVQVQKTVHIDPLNSYYLNLGVDRPNIAWFVRKMNGGKSDLDSLNFVLKVNPTDVEITELLSTMVFFDDIKLSLKALIHLRECLPRQLRGQIAVYNSKRSTRSKRRILQEFKDGVIKILLTTEAAGMGCDIPNIHRVVQFMVPTSLDIWTQRAGRAGRNRSIKAQAFLLVQPTVFQEIKSKGGDEDVVYKKDVEPALRLWIETEDCRREPQANTYNDRRQRTVPLGFCCDNCLRRKDPNHPLLVIPQVPSKSLPNTVEDSQEPSSEVNTNGKRPMVAVPATRKDTHLASVRLCVEEWRDTTYLSNYASCSWGAHGLLPPKVLTQIATKARLYSIDDLIGVGWSSIFARKHGSDLLAKIAAVDKKHYDTVQAAKDAKEAARKQEAEEKARLLLEKKEAEKKAKEAEKEAKREAARLAKEAKQEAARKLKEAKQVERLEKEKENAKQRPAKRSPGRPRKHPLPEESTSMDTQSQSPAKRPRPRPRPQPSQTIKPPPMTPSVLPRSPLQPSPSRRNTSTQIASYPFQIPFTPVTPISTHQAYHSPVTPIPYPAYHSLVPYGLQFTPNTSYTQDNGQFTYFTLPTPDSTDRSRPT